jgi:hypothetical protein
MLLLLVGCDPTPSPPGTTLEKASELSNLREWSVLQGVEHMHRLEEARKPFLIIEQANGSNLNVVGLPIVEQSMGYVWIIANPTSEPAVKRMPSTSGFSLTQEQYDTISRKVQLHPEVAAYLRAHVRGG